MIPSQYYYLGMLDNIRVYGFVSRIHYPSELFVNLFTDKGDPNRWEIHTRLADDVLQARHMQGKASR
jgi:hypothetical protein